MKTITYDPEKYKLVPVEPTREMHKAYLLSGESLGDTWKALLASAPEAPPAASEPVGDDARDAARLNWLRDNLFEHKWNGVVGTGCSVQWQVRSDFRFKQRELTENSGIAVGDFRRAIDAAMGTTPHPSSNTATELVECQAQRRAALRTIEVLQDQAAETASVLKQAREALKLGAAMYSTAGTARGQIDAAIQAIDKLGIK